MIFLPFTNYKEGKEEQVKRKKVQNKKDMKNSSKYDCIYIVKIEMFKPS